MIPWTLIGLIALPLVLLVIAIWIWIRTRKKGKQKLEIPADILDQLDHAERRYAQSNGTINPQQILWDLAKSTGRTNGISNTGEYKPSPRVVPERPFERPNIQSYNRPVFPRAEYQPSSAEQQPSTDKGSSRKSFASRLRRR